MEIGIYLGQLEIRHFELRQLEAQQKTYLHPGAYAILKGISFKGINYDLQTNKPEAASGLNYEHTEWGI